MIEGLTFVSLSWK